MNRVQALLLSVLVVALSSIAIAREGRDTIKVREVRDLYYGEVLFHFYQSDYFPAITHLLSALQRAQIPNHQADGELLLGGMYVSYGMHEEASAIFERLLTEEIPQRVRNRAWFYLAKIWYQRAYLEKAEQALLRIEGKSEKDLDAQRRLLMAQVLIGQQRYEEAATLLDRWRGPKDLGAYARFNLGVALIRNEQPARGMRELARVGKLRAHTEELRGLRDKANLALGYAYLQRGEAKPAQRYLERVRVKGPFSGKAMLGAGWAHTERENYKKALVPWMELQEHPVIDTAVQESLLGVPYALGQLQLYEQAARHYQGAIDLFENEIGQLGRFMEAIQRGWLEEILLQREIGKEMGWFWRLKEIPASPEFSYLIHLLADHDFQEAFKNLRDLGFLKKNLAHWADSIGAYDELLDARKQAYAIRLPRVETSLQRLTLGNMRARRDQLAVRLEQAQASDDIELLADANEKAMLERLAGIGSHIDNLPADEKTAALRTKQRFLDGVLRWRMHANHAERLWRVRKGLKQLDKSIESADRQRDSLQWARLETPTRFEGYGGTISILRGRVGDLAGRVDRAIDTQQQLLRRLASGEIETQQRRLKAYRVQAYLALAQINDRITHRTAAGTE